MPAQQPQPETNTTFRCIQGTQETIVQRIHSTHDRSYKESEHRCQYRFGYPTPQGLKLKLADRLDAKTPKLRLETRREATAERCVTSKRPGPVFGGLSARGAKSKREDLHPPSQTTGPHIYIVFYAFRAPPTQQNWPPPAGGKGDLHERVSKGPKANRMQKRRAPMDLATVTGSINAFIPAFWSRQVQNRSRFQPGRVSGAAGASPDRTRSRVFSGPDTVPCLLPAPNTVLCLLPGRYPNPTGTRAPKIGVWSARSKQVIFL